MDVNKNDKKTEVSLEKQILKALKATKDSKNVIQPKTGRGAQFVFAAATVANILCENLTEQQINLLANFLAVVTTCAYAILKVEGLNSENSEQIVEESGQIIEE